MDEARIQIGDEDPITVPVVTGTEGERALDISRLRSDASLITLDGGYGNTAEAESRVTYINGEEGILRYRGVSDRATSGQVVVPGDRLPAV